IVASGKCGFSTLRRFCLLIATVWLFSPGGRYTCKNRPLDFEAIGITSLGDIFLFKQTLVTFFGNVLGSSIHNEIYFYEIYNHILTVNRQVSRLKLDVQT
ncbi:MAG: hypothetical protein ACRCX2_00060, partial [Paraclostridium sp.]